MPADEERNHEQEMKATDFLNGLLASGSPLDADHPGPIHGLEEELGVEKWQAIELYREWIRDRCYNGEKGDRDATPGS